MGFHSSHKLLRTLRVGSEKFGGPLESIDRANFAEVWPGLLNRLRFLASVGGGVERSRRGRRGLGQHQVHEERV